MDPFGKGLVITPDQVYSAHQRSDLALTAFLGEAPLQRLICCKGECVTTFATNRRSLEVL
jgi:hypothetical protein